MPLQIGVSLHNPVVDFKQLESNLECCFDHPRYTVVFNLLLDEDSYANDQASRAGANPSSQPNLPRCKRVVAKSFFRRVGLRRNLIELLIQDFSLTYRLDASDGFWQGGCWLECHQDFLEQLQEAGIIRGYCSESISRGAALIGSDLLKDRSSPSGAFPSPAQPSKSLQALDQIEKLL